MMREEERDGPRERLGQPERRKGKGGGWAGLSLGWAEVLGWEKGKWASRLGFQLGLGLVSSSIFFS